MIHHQSPGIDVRISSEGLRRAYNDNRVIDITPVSGAKRLAIEIRLGCAGGAVLFIAALMVVKLWGIA
jgi:hypothetical protein